MTIKLTVKHWKFYVETENEGKGYLLASGELVKKATGVEQWTGTYAQANAESLRRSDLYEGRICGYVNRLICEAQG